MPSLPLRAINECTAANHQQGTFVTIRIAVSDHSTANLSITEEHPGTGPKTITAESLSSQSKLVARFLTSSSASSSTSCHIDSKGNLVWLASPTLDEDTETLWGIFSQLSSSSTALQKWTVLRGDAQNSFSTDLQSSSETLGWSQGFIDVGGSLWYAILRPQHSNAQNGGSLLQWTQLDLPGQPFVYPSRFEDSLNTRYVGDPLTMSLRPRIFSTLTSKGYVAEWPISEQTSSMPLSTFLNQPPVVHRLETLDLACLDPSKSRLISSASQQRSYLLCLPDGSKEAQLYTWKNGQSRGPFWVSFQHPPSQPSLIALSISEREERLVINEAGSAVYLQYTDFGGLTQVRYPFSQAPSMRQHLYARQEDGSQGHSNENGASSSGGVIWGSISSAAVVIGLIIYCAFFRRKRNAILINKIMDKYSGQNKTNSPSLTPLSDDYVVRPAPHQVPPLGGHSFEHEREDQEQIALQKMQIHAHSTSTSVAIASASLVEPMAPPQPPFAPGYEVLQQPQLAQPQQYQLMHHHQQPEQVYSTPIQSIQQDNTSVASTGWHSPSSTFESPIILAAAAPGGYAGKEATVPVSMAQHYRTSSAVSASAPSVTYVSASGSGSSSQPAESITLYEISEKERLRRQTHAHQQVSQPLPHPHVVAHSTESGMGDGDNLPPPPPYLQKVEATLQEPSAPLGVVSGGHNPQLPLGSV